MKRLSLLASTALMLIGCEAPPDHAALPPAQLAYSAAAAPEGAPEGSCWGLDISPAVVETVTIQVLVEPEQTDGFGTVLRPAIYRTETHQEIVQPRQEIRFETPCLAQMTPDFITSLQRALTARGFYRGAISGALDSRTQRAIRAFQAEAGPDSAILSLAAARRLGLIAVPRET